MSPLMISLLVFVAVQALLGALLFLFNDGSGKITGKASQDVILKGSKVSAN